MAMRFCDDAYSPLSPDWTFGSKHVCVFRHLPIRVQEESLLDDLHYLLEQGGCSVAVGTATAELASPLLPHGPC
jgi:hypothetical protein